MSERIKVYVLRPKGRPTLQLQWLDPVTGARKTRNAGTADPQKAEQARADLEYELRHDKYQEASKLDWDKFRRMFEDEYIAALRPRSREKYGTAFDVFEQIMKPSKLGGITERTISAFARGMRERKLRGGKVGLAPITIRNYLINLKTGLAWAVAQKMMASLPAFPKIKVPKTKPSPIPAEAFEKLLAKTPDSLWRAYLLCGWWAGLRLSEALQLRWEPSEEWPWIDFEGNRVKLPAAFAKNGKEQSVPLHPVLRQSLAELPRSGHLVFPFRNRYGRPMRRECVTSRVLRLAKQAGVRLSMHKLRKGFGCRVAKLLGKGRAPILHELMRHSSMQITMDYYANVDDVLQEAIGELT